MPLLGVYVPVAEVFPAMVGDFATFSSTVRSLSRTDTLFWCARLNLILSNPQNRKDKGKQEYAIGHFFDGAEIQLLNGFAAKHAGTTVFFREQLLELVRWTALLAEDQPEDGKTFEDPEVRRRFAQAVLMAGELWGQRVYRDGLAVTGDHAEDLRQAMPIFRHGLVSRASELVTVLARGVTIYQDFQRIRESAAGEFRAVTGIAIEEYMACLWKLSIDFVNIEPKTADQNSGGFRLDVVRASIPPDMREPFDCYIKRESQTADELRLALLNGRLEADDKDPFDALPLRDRPILRTSDGRAIVLDSAFFSEKASVGPLFILVKALGKSKKVNEIFGAFGDAFEAYVNGLLRSMYPSSPLLGDRLICNPKGSWAGEDIEVADACLHEVTEVVLFETKGVFIGEGKTQDLPAYEAELRKKYGKSTSSPGERGLRGAAQLGRWIKGIALGEVVPAGPNWSLVRCVYPVLVVYDPALGGPGHAQFFAEEFRVAVEPDDTLPTGVWI